MLPNRVLLTPTAVLPTIVLIQQLQTAVVLYYPLHRPHINTELVLITPVLQLTVIRRLLRVGTTAQAIQSAKTNAAQIVEPLPPTTVEGVPVVCVSAEIVLSNVMVTVTVITPTVKTTVLPTQPVTRPAHLPQAITPPVPETLSQLL